MHMHMPRGDPYEQIQLRVARDRLGALTAFARLSGKSRNQLIRDAIDVLLIAEHNRVHGNPGPSEGAQHFANTVAPGIVWVPVTRKLLD
jgi:hypothetical protein